jgi:hypothetical protein
MARQLLAMRFWITVLALTVAGCASPTHWYAERMAGKVDPDGVLRHPSNYLVIAGPFDTKSACVDALPGTVKHANEDFRDYPQLRIDLDRCICKIESEQFAALHR